MLFTGSVRVYTDVQQGSKITDPTDLSMAQESIDAAVRAERLFLPTVLHCELDENLRRVVSEERRNGGTMKLTRLGRMMDMRAKYVLSRFETGNERGISRRWNWT
jgi:hypothetical protein